MKHYIHNCIAKDFLEIADTSLENYFRKIQLLMSAVMHLQSHCSHLEEVLRANNITMPVKENNGN